MRGVSLCPNQVTAATSCSVYIDFLFYVDIVVCVNYVRVCDNIMGFHNIIQVNECRPHSPQVCRGGGEGGGKGGSSPCEINDGGA